jgi:tRNA 2-thiocytidine biosynthesis protein TtcA
VRPSHLLDRDLFDFAAVKATGIATADGDKGFDPQEQFPTSGDPGLSVISLSKSNLSK